MQLGQRFSIRFQFLYGAIKGAKHFIDFEDTNVFQFLYGAIKGTIKTIHFIYANLFQFLYGAIKGLSTRFQMRLRYPISIPVWCD